MVGKFCIINRKAYLASNLDWSVVLPFVQHKNVYKISSGVESNRTICLKFNCFMDTSTSRENDPVSILPDSFFQLTVLDSSTISSLCSPPQECLFLSGQFSSVDVAGCRCEIS
jgi:hypothetical protein